MQVEIKDFKLSWVLSFYTNTTVMACLGCWLVSHCKIMYVLQYFLYFSSLNRVIPIDVCGDIWHGMDVQNQRWQRW